jgi:hypothetical protein
MRNAQFRSIRRFWKLTLEAVTSAPDGTRPHRQLSQATRFVARAPAAPFDCAHECDPTRARLGERCGHARQEERRTAGDGRLGRRRTAQLISCDRNPDAAPRVLPTWCGHRWYAVKAVARPYSKVNDAKSGVWLAQELIPSADRDIQRCYPRSKLLDAPQREAHQCPPAVAALSSISHCAPSPERSRGMKVFGI